MKNSEPSLIYAIDKATGHLVSVKDVPNGESCNCICPECKEPLIARQGKLKNKKQLRNEKKMFNFAKDEIKS